MTPVKPILSLTNFSRSPDENLTSPRSHSTFVAEDVWDSGEIVRAVCAEECPSIAYLGRVFGGFRQYIQIKNH